MTIIVTSQITFTKEAVPEFESYDLTTTSGPVADRGDEQSAAMDTGDAGVAPDGVRRDERGHVEAACIADAAGE